MPKIDGLVLAKMIRANPNLSQVALILLTSSDISREEYQAPDVRISRCLSKPIRQSALLDAIVETSGVIPCTEIPGYIEPSSSFASHNGAKILLAEDNEVNQMLVVEMLDIVGANCEIAKNGKQVIEMATGREI